MNDRAWERELDRPLRRYDMMRGDVVMNDRAWERELDRPLRRYDSRLFAWICSRRAGDNARGDFIRDTRMLVGMIDKARTEHGREQGIWRVNSRLAGACEEALREFDRLARAFMRATGETLPTVRDALNEVGPTG